MEKNLLLSTEKNIFKNKWTMRVMAFALILAAMFSIMSIGLLSVSAAPANEGDVESLMRQILDVIFMIFRYVGILLFVWSVAQLVLAFKNEDADSKQRSMIMAIISIVLITLDVLVNPIIQKYL